MKYLRLTIETSMFGWINFVVVIGCRIKKSGKSRKSKKIFTWCQKKIEKQSLGNRKAVRGRRVGEVGTESSGGTRTTCERRWNEWVCREDGGVGARLRQFHPGLATV